MNRQQRRQRDRARPNRPTMTSNRNWGWRIAFGMVVVVAVVVVVLAIGGVFGGGSGDDLSSSQIQLLKAESHLVGDSDAPVEIIEFADFQCPFCRQFWGTSYQQLMSEFVEPGQVAFYFHHMAFLGPESVRAAGAAECADDQGDFETYHDILFALQGPENQGYLTFDQLEAFAEQADLEPTAFSECVRTSRNETAVRIETTNASEAGINSTPTLFVDGKKIENPLNYVEIRTAILSALGES